MDIINLIGNTPVLKLQLPKYGNPNIYTKLEYFNPGGSIKTRVAYAMIKKAQEEGLLKESNELIEATGGNTGLGLAIISNICGYKLTCVIPDNYSLERIKLLKAHGAKVVLSDSSISNFSHIEKCNELMEKDRNLICLDQINNIANLEAHYFGTGTEIWDEINDIDFFVTGVGSGGTFTGVSKLLKEKNKKIKCYVMQPKGCDIIKGTAFKHKIQGVSIGIKPPLLEYSYIDGTIQVEFEKVMQILSYVMKTNGVFLGLSAGANILAAIKLSDMFGKNKNIVTVAPDEGRCYLDEYINIEEEFKNED